MVYLLRKSLFFCQKHFKAGQRFCGTNSKQQIRVRFAPSPTGFLHLGGLRTALFNHVFAKSKKGTTILRIEDTDRTRLVEGSVERIIEDLKWCGIGFDEGPYYQSERIEFYKKYAHQLVDDNKAYYCFCSEKRLELLRKDQMKSREVVRYDKKCRYLTKEEVEEKLTKNEKYCIRFKVNDEMVEFNDLVYGNCQSNIFQVESDPVILKTDGFPTYHLANVVDDHLMEISHVLRGSEWLPSTAKHILLFRAFKWEPPQYCHLPLLLNPDGTKFSKRQGDLEIGHFRRDGIFPGALLNLITRTGGGFNVQLAERDDRNFSLEELIELFDISRVNKSSCKLPMERLCDVNRLEMKKMRQTDDGTRTLINLIRNNVQDYFDQRNLDKKLSLDDDYVIKVLDMSLDRISKISNLLSSDFLFMWIVPQEKFQETESFPMEKFTDFIAGLSEVSWDKDSLAQFLTDYPKTHRLIYRELMHVLRRLLTSLKEGPPVVEVLMLLGKEEALSRLKLTVANVDQRVQM